MDSAWKAGLEDVIAARSAVCTIDGAAGRLYYRGYEIGDLAGAVPFEDVTQLLWSGELPAPDAARDFRARPTAGPRASDPAARAAARVPPAGRAPHRRVGGRRPRSRRRLDRGGREHEEGDPA